MSERARRTSIDALRGLAVGLMVMVHAAATWTPANASNLPILAAVISGLGGLAAPLFVVLFGWGLLQRERGWSERWRQALFLFFCQMVVNLTAPHLFQPFTPGVLSLMALMVLLEPWWSSPLRNARSPSWMFVLYAFCILAFVGFGEPFQGPSAWNDRVETTGFSQWVSHMLLTGTYPFLPWVLFGAFGATIALQPERWRLITVFATGLFVSFVLLGYALLTGTVWALPTGDAMLTFFPANGPFLIAALTGVSLLWLVVDRWSWFHGLSRSGRCSLSLYVAHFVPLYWLHALDEQGGWGLHVAVVATVAYTGFWLLLGTLWWKRMPHLTLEAAWRRWSRPSSESQQQRVGFESVEN